MKKLLLCMFLLTILIVPIDLSLINSNAYFSNAQSKTSERKSSEQPNILNNTNFSPGKMITNTSSQKIEKTASDSTPLENLTRIKMYHPYASHGLIGNFTGGDEYEYVMADYDNSTLLFFNITSGKIYARYNETYSTSYDGIVSMYTANLDNDSYDELVVLNSTGYLFLIDNNLTTLKIINLGIGSLNTWEYWPFIKIKDLNNDGFDDLVIAIENDTNDLVAVLNGATLQIAANFTTSVYTFEWYTIGNFNDSQGEEIAIAYDNGSVAIYDYTLTRLVNRTFTTAVSVMTTISNSSWHYDALVLQFYNLTSNFDIYNASTLQSMGYNDTIDQLYSLEPVVGDLTGDSTSEIIFPTQFPDGYGISIYDLKRKQVINKVRLIGKDDYIRAIKTAKITADNKYDIVFVGSQEVTVFKGVNDPDSDIAFLRKIDEPNWPITAFVAQYNTGLNDIFINGYFGLYIYPTDSAPPRLSNLLTNPVRPTAEDGLFYLTADVIDESDFDNPQLTYNFTTFEGTVLTSNENTELIKTSHEGSEYSVYFFNIVPGVYTYKITVKDIYDNQMVYDNNGSLYTVTVYSSRIYSNRVQDNIESAKYAMAVGNLDGDAYSDVVVAGEKNISIVWGNNTETIVPLASTPVAYPTVYLGNFDSIAGDDIVFAFFNTTTGKYEVNVYHGSTFNLMYNYSFTTNITLLKTGDLTNDGFDELIIVTESSTTAGLNDLYVIDVNNNLTLKTYKNIPQIHCMLVDNISNDAYLDLAYLSISDVTSTFNLTVITGGSNAVALHKLYSYNNTYSGTLYSNFLFFDNFLTLKNKQFLIVIDTYTPYLYVINGTDGTPISPSGTSYGYYIAYTTGLTVIDSNYDGLKELATLGYDKSITVTSLVNGYLYSVPTHMTSAPFASYWVNFDDEPHKDLVYATSTGLYIFSPYTSRVESVTYPFRPLASVGVGNFFQLPFFDACTLSVDGILEKYININTFYRLKINVQLKNDTIPEGDYIDATVNVKNVFNDSITTASILGIFKFNNTIVQVSSFITLKNGTYVLTQALNNLPMGTYNLSVLVSENYYGTFTVSHSITLLGEIIPYTKVYSSEDVNKPVYVNVTLVDQYGFPVFNANITAKFANTTYYPIESLKNSYFFALDKSDLKVGAYTISFNATHKYAVESISFSSSVTIITEPRVEFAGNGITQPPVVQGQPMNLKVTLRDATNHTLTGGTITATFFGKIYTFSDLGNGTYVTSIITQNIPGGKWPLTVQVSHPYLVPEIFAGNITVFGFPVFEYKIKPGIVTQNSNMTINVTLVDLYGYPVTNASVKITFMNRTYTAENIRDNIYVVTIPIGKVHYGLKEGHILVLAENHKSHGKDFDVFIYPEIPKLELSPMALLSLFGVSIAVSFLGLGLYYFISSKLTKSFAYDERGRLVMSFKSLDRIYTTFIGILLFTLATAEVLFIIHAYELSVATLGLVLLEVLLLHGIWLYRDTATSMIEEQLPLKRMLIGLWHILFAPLIILLIFAWARNIDWFAYYLLEGVTTIGGLKLPSLYLSLIGTYVTSVIVLAINIYLNSRRYVRRFSEMRSGGTPENVINDEKIIQLNRMSSSIRLKFLVFLGILGASIVSTATPLLQYYQLGVVVVIPLVVVVIIPYLISQLLRFLGIAKRVTKKITAPVIGTQGPSGSQ